MRTSPTGSRATKVLLGGARGAYYNVTHTGAEGSYPTEEEAGELQLVAASEEGANALWEDLLPPVLSYAKALPCHIAQWVGRQSRAGFTGSDRPAKPPQPR